MIASKERAEANTIGLTFNGLQSDTLSVQSKVINWGGTTGLRKGDDSPHDDRFMHVREEGEQRVCHSQASAKDRCQANPRLDGCTGEWTDRGMLWDK